VWPQLSLVLSLSLARRFGREDGRPSLHKLLFRWQRLELDSLFPSISGGEEWSLSFFFRPFFASRTRNGSETLLVLSKLALGGLPVTRSDNPVSTLRLPSLGRPKERSPPPFSFEKDPPLIIMGGGVSSFRSQNNIVRTNPPF